MNKTAGCGLAAVICFLLSLAAGSVSYASGDRQGDAMERLSDALRRGDFNRAIIYGNEAERAYEKEGNIKLRIAALMRVSSAYQAVGQYRRSLDSLKTALGLSGKEVDETLRAAVLADLGNAYIFTNQLTESENHLKEALEISRRNNSSDIQASALNYLGNLYVLRKKNAEGLAAYRESARLSEQTGNGLLYARAMANSARVSLAAGNYQDTEDSLRAAHDKYLSLYNSHEKAYGLINIGRTHRQLTLSVASAAPSLKSRAEMAFIEAASAAEDIIDLLAASYAQGYLGQMYEEAGRPEEALRLTRKALFAGQQVNAPESMYLWQWQTGRLLKAEGKPGEALSAYRDAVNTLQTIRAEMVADCRMYNQLSFKDSVEPVYFGLADLLLKQADQAKDEAEAGPFLKETRRTMEMLKTAELQDYFQDACIAADRQKTKALETISSNAAVLYVIPLPDRLELLLGLDKGIKRFTVRVDAGTFTREVRSLRKRLEKRTTRQYLTHSQRLYDWMIRPLETELSAAKIDTLILVPHGPLYTIPLAALHDGEVFLIQKYALASTPGLTLADPRHMQRDKIKILLAGLTEPVQGFPALINVPMEIKAIQELYAGKVLKDRDFSIASMREELERSPYPVIHIASHGEFFDDSRDTYIITWDEKIGVDQLEKLIGVSKYSKEPVALLTLSACVTAAGDDRAALGLAGVGIKAGARSALATLWYINDHTSYELVTEFYRQLQNDSLSNAQALQQAQMKLLSERGFVHPGYWAPFLLIGNWL